jgi:hypothetical protein
MSQKLKNPNSSTEMELDKAQEQFDKFDQNVKDLTLDRMNEAPKQELEPQTKISTRDAQKSDAIYLKPDKSIGTSQPFNERFRADYERDKTYVQFIAEHKEIIGETIEIWTRPYGGMPAEFWKVPVNKPVWGPLYLAEQIKRKFYHRLTMKEDRITSSDGMGSYFGQMVADTTIPRLEARPVSQARSIFLQNSFT